MSNFNKQIRYLALSLMDGGWTHPTLVNRIERSLGDHFPDSDRLAARLLFHFDSGASPSKPELVDFLAHENLLSRFFKSHTSFGTPKILLDSPLMQPLPEQMITLPLLHLATWRDLRLWLGLSNNELAWFADREGRQCKITELKLHHYRYRWFRKQSGEMRLIEIPKTRLKTIQRQILRDILNKVPPHPCAHGFTRGRSALTYVKNHLGQGAVLHMDLKDFFHSVPAPKIGATFKRLGYPQTLASLLQGICTHATSGRLAGSEFKKLSWERQRHLSNKHLPQGAPTSPAIANLCAWGLDCRLAGLADHYGLAYSRYADDLAFSGPTELLRLAPFLQSLIGTIALEEGFTINHRKTRLHTQAQSQRLAGMVINEKPNLPRKEYDKLKATLYNCIRYGPESQNRNSLDDFKAYLTGKVSYACWLNPVRGKRIQSLWKRIEWPD